MHFEEKDFEAFRNDTMDTQEMITFLEHLDSCDFCLGKMIRQEEASGIVTTPGYLKEQILEKAASPDIQVTKTAAETSRRMQLLFYSLRTAAGVLAALFLLFSVTQVDFTALRSRPSLQTEAQAAPPKTHSGRLSDFTKGVGKGISDSTQKFTGYLNDLFK